MKPVILNQSFEYLEVGGDNLIISSSDANFYAISRDTWFFLELFKYGALVDYVLKKIERNQPTSKSTIDEYRKLIATMMDKDVLVESSKFINPKLQREYCRSSPILKEYNIEWIRNNHPETIISDKFCDTWNPASPE